MTRERIFDGALEILDSGSYGDLTVDALARSLRMSKSTLYKHFVSKEAVVVGLIDQICVDTDMALERVPPGEPLATFRGAAEVMAGFSERLPRAAVLQPELLPSACRIRMQVTFKRIERAQRDALERGAASGTFRVEDPRLTGIALSAAVRAVVEAAASGELERTPSDAVREVFTLSEAAVLAAR